MSTAVTVETTTQEEVKLTTRQQTQLRTSLKAYQTIQEEIKLLEERKEEVKAEVAKLRDAIGVTSLKFEGFTVTYVAGTRTFIDKKKVLALGINLDAVSTTTPTKAFEKITLPGARSSKEDD